MLNMDLCLTTVSLNVSRNDLYLKEMRRTGQDQVPSADPEGGTGGPDPPGK